MKKLLLKASTVLPVSSPPLHNAAVIIENGIISDIGPAGDIVRRNKDAQTLDLKRGILMPGFINAHTHLELGWIRSKIGAFDGFTGWLRQIIRAKREGVSDGDIEQSVRDGIRELINTGVTTVGEISSYGGLDKSILRESGLRTVLFREVLDSKDEITDFDKFEKSRNFEERLFPHAPYSCSPSLLEKVLDSHKKNKIPIAIHLGESPEEIEFIRRKANSIEGEIFPLIGKRPFERSRADTPLSYLKTLGFLDTARLTAIHMVHVSADEIADIENSGMGIVLCPRSNMYLRVGMPPLDIFTGLSRVGLGTDGLSSNYNLDFFEEIRALHMLYSVSAPADAAYKTVYTATLGGARSLFIEDRTGSIEPGKEADMIFLNESGRADDEYLSVISSTPQNLELLMVGGEILYRKRDSDAP